MLFERKSAPWRALKAQPETAYPAGYIGVDAAKIANWIRQEVGGGLFSIVVTESYSSGYDECLDRAADEKAKKARPKLVHHIDHREVNMPDNFVLIKGGTFNMGSPESEPWRGGDETLHTVTVSDFYIGIYKVTQSEYQSVTGENPSNFKGDDLPVESVSRYDAIKKANPKEVRL